MKRVKLLPILFAIILFITSCTNSNKGQEIENKGEDRIKIVTSIYPIYDFTKKIVGDKADVQNLLPMSTDAHGWEPTPKDILMIEDADIFIYSGAGMESWVNDILSSIGNDNLVVLEASQGIDLIELAHEEHEEHNHHEHEENELNHHEHNHGKYDPHVWTSLRNAVIELENIKDTVSTVDKENSEFYLENYEEYKKILQDLDEKFTEKINEFERNDIVVSHEAFGYLCRDYNLNQIGVEDVFSSNEPDPQKMKEIIDFIVDKNIKVVFYESSGTKKVAEQIAKETGIEIDSLNPLESLTDSEIDSGEDYISIMKSNLDSLENALK